MKQVLGSLQGSSPVQVEITHVRVALSRREHLH